MTIKSVFEFNGYKPYVRAALGGDRKKTGLRAEAARAMGCQTAYLSQILHGQANLSLEQAYALSDFLNHDPEEREYFWLLVQKERAGTKALEEFVDGKLKQMLEHRMTIRNRLKIEEGLSKEDQTTYYSHWLYAAVHVMVSVPALATKAALIQHLALPPKQVVEVVEFLESRGLIVFESGRYKMGSKHFHLAHDSPHIRRHQTNWRVRTITAIDNAKPDDMHYSVVVSLSRADVRKVKEKLLETIQENMKVIADSPEECVFATAIDFYEL